MNAIQKPSIYELIRKYAAPLWKEILWLILLSLLATVFTTMQPIFISGLLEVVMGSDGSKELISSNAGMSTHPLDLNTLGKEINNYIYESMQGLEGDKFQLVLTIVIFFLLVSLLASIFSYASQVTSSWVRFASACLIRKDLAQHILSLDMEFFHDKKSGELASRFNQDVSSIAIGLGPLLHGFIQHGLLIIIYSAYLFSTDPTLAVGVIVIGFLHWLVTKIVKKPVRSLERNYFDKLAQLMGSFQEVLTSVRAIKSFGVEGFFHRKNNKNIDSLRDAEFKSSLVRQLDPNLRLFIDNLAISGIFILGVIQVQSSELTLQGFLLFLLVGKLLITPINKFSVNFVWIQALLASYDRIFEIFQIQSSIQNGNNKTSHLTKEIEFIDVDFSYGHNSVLSNISFKLKKGEVVAIVGPSGTGKSTLTDLILRLYDPDNGKILVDGVDLKRVNIKDYKKMFGVVSQENFLINDTVKSNICFGSSDCKLEDVEYVAKIANAHHFIESLPNGYDTIVGDKGVKLSGGQRQRISIARAIYKKPEIVIFDEATSSLDSESESKVHIAIENVLSDTTAIVVAHRLSTIIQADSIIVLNNGKIEAIGKHKSLLESSKTYRTLYDLQFRSAS